MTVLNAFSLELLNTDPTGDQGPCKESKKWKRLSRIVHKSRLMLLGLNQDFVSRDRGLG